jgi:Trp operon repressor
MSQVSKKFLETKTQARIFKTFAKFFGSVAGKGKTEEVLLEFLTPTEKIYLTKRLMIAYFMIKEVDYRTISKVLKVSLSNVTAVSQRLQTKDGILQEELSKFFAKETFKKEAGEFLDAFFGQSSYLRNPQMKQHQAEHDSY